MKKLQTPRGPGRPRSTNVDAAILDAGLDLLIECGVEAFSIEQVAQRAGVTRATIYRRFPGKIPLLIAAIGAGHEAPADVPERVDVEQMLAYWAEALSKPALRRLTRRLMTSLHDFPELHEAYWNASVKQRELSIRTILEQARDRGQFPAGADLEIIQKILTGAIAEHLTTEPDTATMRDIEDFLLAVLRQTGYRAPN